MTLCRLTSLQGQCPRSLSGRRRERARGLDPKVIDRVANTLSDIGTAWTTLRNRVQSLPATTRESFDAFVDVFGDAADTLAERGDQVRGTVRTLRSDTQQRWRTAIERSADALDAVRPTRRANPLVDNTPKENLTPAAKSHASREDKTEKVRQVITLAMTRAASSATGVATGPADAYDQTAFKVGGIDFFSAEDSPTAADDQEVGRAEDEQAEVLTDPGMVRSWSERLLGLSGLRRMGPSTPSIPPSILGVPTAFSPVEEPQIEPPTTSDDDEPADASGFMLTPPPVLADEPATWEPEEAKADSGQESSSLFDATPQVIEELAPLLAGHDHSPAIETDQDDDVEAVAAELEGVSAPEYTLTASEDEDPLSAGSAEWFVAFDGKPEAPEPLSPLVEPNDEAIEDWGNPVDRTLESASETLAETEGAQVLETVESTPALDDLHIGDTSTIDSVADAEDIEEVAAAPVVEEGDITSTIGELALETPSIQQGEVAHEDGIDDTSPNDIPVEPAPAPTWTQRLLDLFGPQEEPKAPVPILSADEEAASRAAVVSRLERMLQQASPENDESDPRPEE